MNTNDRAHEIAEALIGTANSLHNAADEAELEDTALLEALDELTQCCNTCSWWFETDEIDEEGDCTECSTIGTS